MSSKETAFKNMLILLDQMEEIKGNLEIIDEKLTNLRTYTEVGDLVTLPQAPHLSTGRSFNHAIKELTEIVGIRSNVEEILKSLEIQKGLDVEYEVGCILKSKFQIRAKAKGPMNYEIDVNSQSQYYSKETEFVVIDNIDGRNFVLTHKGYNDSLIFANKSQLDALMEKTDRIIPQSVTKIEFAINGPDPIKYKDKLTKFKFYVNPCSDRNKSDYRYDRFYNNESALMNVTYDEAFGIMGTAYVLNSKVMSYESIVTIWSDLDTGTNSNGGYRRSKYDANKIGFHKKSNESYEYNSNISYFVPNNYPKDVFTSRGSKDKTLTILAFKRTFDGGKKDENQYQTMV
ncbi:hypothetical protein D3C87_82590 [compost metagenome]